MHTACSRRTGRSHIASNATKPRKAPQSSNNHAKTPVKEGPEREQKSKKAIAEAKRIRVADQTFGIKNKGKSAKAKPICFQGSNTPDRKRKPSRNARRN